MGNTSSKKKPLRAKSPEPYPDHNSSYEIADEDESTLETIYQKEKRPVAANGNKNKAEIDESSDDDMLLDDTDEYMLEAL